MPGVPPTQVRSSVRSSASVLSALRMARDARRPEPGLVHHPIVGVKYASGDYGCALAAYGMLASMSGKGDCYDNAVAESFFSTLEFELVMQNDWPTREKAWHAIFTLHRDVVQSRGDITQPSDTSVRRRTKSSCKRQRSSYHSRVHFIGSSPPSRRSVCGKVARTDL
jgi:transposase InsO family protein